MQFFFVLYWRKWLLTHPYYTLKNNCVPQNAYVGIELNAHALIILLQTIRNNFPGNDTLFRPWCLGSQSCEQIFRTVRSMSSTF